jgi:hypothetical protein
MLACMEAYRFSLRAHSGPLMHCIDWRPAAEENVEVVNDIAVFYRYVDQDLPREIDDLRRHDESRPRSKSKCNISERETVADAVGDGLESGGNADGLARQAAHKRAADLAAMPRMERKLVPGSPLFDQVVGHLRARVLPLLRSAHRQRRRRSAGENRRGKIANMTLIDELPGEIEKRLVQGHWEGDLIKGRRNQSQMDTASVKKSSNVVSIKSQCRLRFLPCEPKIAYS